MNCHYCGSDDTEYTGVDDGGGDYGSSVCDYYFCNSCELSFEANCIDVGSDELIDQQPKMRRWRRKASDVLWRLANRQNHQSIDDIPF